MRMLLGVRADGAPVKDSIIFQDIGQALDYSSSVLGNDPEAVSLVSLMVFDGCYLLPNPIDGSHNYATFSAEAGSSLHVVHVDMWRCVPVVRTGVPLTPIENTASLVNEILEMGTARDDLRECADMLGERIECLESVSAQQVLSEAEGELDAHMSRLWSRMESLYSDIVDECPSAVNMNIEPL